MDTFFFNTGVSNATYNRETGNYSGFGNGIYEFRVGGLVENVHTGQKFVIDRLDVRKPGAIGSPCVVWVNDGKQNCCITMLRPTNPERIHFGFVLTTKTRVGENPVGSAQRFRTFEEAEREIERLNSIGFDGVFRVHCRD